ncbi:MAG: type II secretion system protein [Burkholderiales bacterium]
MSIERAARRERGISLIELVLFIVVVGAGLAGVLTVFNVTVSRSADPLPAKQAWAIAESLLEEVELAAETMCDPDDANALTAASAADCASLPEGPGPEPGDGRPFDNVNDYDGFAMAGITDLTGAPIAGLGAYNASIAVSSTALAGAPALLITVTVTGPRGATATLSGYRTRHAPNSLP